MPRTTLAHRRERLRLRLLETGPGRRTSGERQLWRKHRGQGSGAAEERRKMLAIEAWLREREYRRDSENGRVATVCEIAIVGAGGVYVEPVTGGGIRS